MKHLLTFLRHGVSGTLASTVGSPSFDRRGTVLKHYAFMLLFLLGSLNVWGAEVSWNCSTLGSSTKTGPISGDIDANISFTSSKGGADNATAYNKDGTIRLYYKNTGNGSDLTLTPDEGVTITEVVLTASKNYAVDFSYSIDGGAATAGSWSDLSATISDISATSSFKIVNKSKTTQLRLTNITITYSAGGTPQPTVSAEPNDESYGSVSVSGTTITANPNEGYRVMSGADGYSVIVGDPTSVTNNGDNTFTVSTTADCTIKINFEAIPQYTVTWNNHGLTSTSQVYEGEKPVFPETPTSCDATSTTFIGWATENWTGKLADLAGKTVYTSATEMPAVTGPVEYFAVYAKTTAGDEEEHEGPSFSRSGTTDTYTSGYTFSAQASGETGYYQDGSGTLRYIQVLNATTPIFSATPNRVTVTAKIGGGTGGKDLTDPVQAQLLDNTGAPITGAVVAITSHITTATGDTYADIEIPTAGITSAYGVRISHQKQSGYNVRYYSFSLKYYTGGATYSDYMTTCAAAGTCEAPSFSPAAGTFDEAQDITLQTSTQSAHIYYTLDGTDPDNGSDEYSTPIHITQNTTIKAITYADGLTESSISEGVFNIRCAQPTFSPVGGDYDVAQNVIISADGADHIYYTINGDDPSVDPANLYDGSAIAINTTGSHTIKAIAVKEGYANSNVASATYVMDLPYGSIAEFIEGAPTAAAKDLVFEAEDNCVITGINGTTIYVQDASGKGIMIFGLASLPTNAAVNHQITGTINAKYTSFKGQHEMTNVDFSGASISEDPVSRPTPAAVTGIDATNFNAHTMVLVSIENLYYKSSSEKTHKFATTEGGSTEYTIYDQFGMLSEKTMPETSVACDLIGILSRYNATYQLLPILATDIAADADAAAPVFTPAGGATEGEAFQVDLNSYVSIAPADANHSVNITSAQITTTEPVSVTAVSSRDFYRNTSVTKWYYGNSASASYEINGQGSTAQGTIVAKVNDEIAASAKENDEVHVFVTPNAHFQLATIKVNGNDPTEVTAGEEYSFTMPGEAVTIAVTWTEDAKATLNFAKGDADGEEAAPENIVDYIGETIQLPANPFTYTGHKFAGWSCDGGTTKLAAGANYVLAEDKAFVAQWDEIPTFNNSGYEWQLVTSVDQLVAGKYYVMASTAKGKVMSNTISSNVAGEIAATFTDGVIAYNAFGSQSADAAGVAVLQLGGEEDAWTLTEVVANDALLGATAEKKLAWGSGTTTWSISIASDNATTIQNGTSSYGRFLHNVNSNRFTTYTSNTSASMLLPQLYVWAEKVYKLRYDANGGENAPTATPAVAGKVTVTDAKPTAPSGKIFDGWNENASGTGANYSAGDEVIVSSADVTLYAQWREPNTYSISYNANGGTLIEGESEITPNPTSVTEGNAYTIEENVYEVEGKLFIGWKANGVTYNAGQEIYPTENMTFVAQWSAWTATDFVLVTDKAQLKDGDKVYIVAAEYERAMGTQNTNYRNEVVIQKAGGSIKVMEGAEPVELTLGKDGDNFTFKDGTGYLYAAGTKTSKENYMNTKVDADAACNWTITIDENGTKITSVVNDKTPFMQYNPGSTRFSCYNTASQQAVVLYKKENAEPVYETVRSGLEVNRYYTVCLPKKVTAIKGASFWTLNSKSQDGAIAYLEEETNNLPFAAGKPFIIQATAAQLEVVYEGAATGEAGINGALHGTLVYMDAAALAAAGPDVYMLFSNELRPVGVNNHLDANRAYVKLSELDPVAEAPQSAPGRRVRAMPMQPQVATGLEAAEANEAPRKVLINGEFFIIRGEKMYDAKGQLVK